VSSIPAPSTVKRGHENRLAHDFELACPDCRTPLAPSKPPDASFRCQECSFELRSENGIWQAIPRERLLRYRQFIREYEYVRQAEGRGSSSAEYYLGLPFHDASGSNPGQWAIRARTFLCLRDQLLPSLQRPGSGLKILDLGAGNGWFSYRMALAGHRPAAVDLLTNDFDALGAATIYQGHLAEPFPLYRAELDKLPFAAAGFDFAVFNASFHYAEDYTATLGEALRCLRRGGMVVIADTPWYSREASGRAMVCERQQLFLDRFGFASDSIASLEFLTDERLAKLEREFGIRWEIYHPSYGLRWALRPWMARLRGRREPSQFRIYAARLPQ